MKKNGFTLVEMLAAVALLVLIVLIAFPAIIGVIQKTGGKIDESTKLLILNAAKNKVEQNKNSYSKVVGNYYWFTIQDLIDDGYLISELKEGSNSGDINKNRYIKVEVVEETIDGKQELKYKYKICNEEKNECVE